MNIILFLATIISFIYIWSTSYITTPLRNLISKIRLLNVINSCPSCMTWWATLLISQFYNPFNYSNINIINSVILSAIGYTVMDIIMSIKSNRNGGCSGGCKG